MRPSRMVNFLLDVFRYIGYKLNMNSLNKDSAKVSSTKTSRDEQREQRNQKILSVALDLFIRRGFAGTRIQDIARDADMSVGLLFHYYPSKEKLYEALVRIGLEGTRDAMKCDASDAIGFFSASAARIFRVLKSYPFAAKIFVLMGQAVNNDAVPEDIRKIVGMVSVVADSIPLIERGQREGSIREGDPRALSVAFWGAIQGIAESLAVYPSLECPDAEWIVDIVRKKGA